MDKEKNNNEEKKGFDWKLFWMTLGLIPIITLLVLSILRNQ